MNKTIKNVYIGLPKRLVNNILWVKREARTNPLSHIPGGYDVVVEYHTGKALGYDWIKMPKKYIRKFLPEWVDRSHSKFYKLDKKRQLTIAKKHIAKIYARDKNNQYNDNQSSFVEVWDSETSQEMPWDSFRRKFSNDSINEYFKKGCEHYDHNELEKAIENFTQAIKVNPNLANAYFYRGMIYETQEKLEKAIEDFTQAIKVNPSLANVYNNRGIVYDKQEKSEKAIEDFNETIKINPNCSVAYNNRGYTYLQQGNLEQAKKDLTQAINLNPDYTIAYENRGSVYREEGKIIRSINDFRNGSNSIYSGVGKAIQSAEITQRELDSIAESFYNRITKIKDKNFNDGFEYNDQLIKSNRYDAKNFFNRGIGYFAKKEFEKAIDDFNQYLHLQSSNSDTTNIYWKQGIIKLCRGKFGQAINKFDEYFTIESDNINSDDYFLRGLAQFHSLTFQFGLYGALGDIRDSWEDPWEKVINDFKQALSLNSKDSESYHYLGCIYIFLGKVETSSHIEKGIYYLKQSIKLNPENIKSYNLLANHFFEEEDYQEAIDYCTQGLAIDSSNPNLYQLRGEIYRKQEKFKQAINDFQKAANLFLEEYRNNIGYRNEWGNYQDTIDSIHKIIFPSDP